MPHREPFDPNRKLVVARDFRFAGVPYAVGEPFPKPGVDLSLFSHRNIQRQYDTMAVNHVAEEADEAAIEDAINMVPGPSNGRYTINAPWLDDPMVVRGKVNAEKAFEQIKADGPPLGWIAGGTETGVEELGGGWFAVSAPWLDEPEKVQGREAAEERQREIHSAGAPEQELEPVEGHAASVLISIDGDKRVVTAPWLAAPEEFEGETADADAEARQAELRAEGPPEGWEPPEDGPDANSANAGTADAAATGASEQGGTDAAEKAEGAESGADGKTEGEAGKNDDPPAAP